MRSDGHRPAAQGDVHRAVRGARDPPEAEANPAARQTVAERPESGAQAAPEVRGRPRLHGGQGNDFTKLRFGRKLL
jgi:hypothetical protein